MGTRRIGRCIGVASLLWAGLISGCGNRDVAAEAGVTGAGALVSPEGASLAYEHELDIRLDASQISARVKQLAEACQSSRFGDCAVLQVGQQGGSEPSGSIRVRISPQGVEPIIGLAGKDGDVASRTTQAEDLAQQVADTTLAKARLEKEHARLLAYQDNRDMKVADLLVVSQRLSEIEAGVEQANRDAAQQRRRIDTQLVTLRFNGSAGQQSRSEIGQALRETGAILGSSVAFLIRAAAALLPVAIVLAVAVLLARPVWRRWRRRRSKAG